MKKHGLVLILALGVWLGGWPARAGAQEPAKGTAVEINEKGETVAPKAGTPAAGEANVSSGTLRMLRALEAFHKNVKTVHATFDQVRTDEIFLEKVTSRGELWFDKPARFRCDYANPQPMINLIVGDTLYIYVPELQQADYWTFASAEERDQQLHQLLIGFGFKADDLVKHYEIHSSEDEAGPLAELKKQGLDPNKKVLFQIRPRAAYAETSPFKESKVYVDKASHLPDKIWYKDHTDASLTLTMKKIELDVKLDDALFDKDKLFPKGTEFIDKRNTQ